MIQFPFLKDTMLQKKLEEDGFVTMPFADEKMQSELKEFYSSLDNPAQKGTHVTMFNPSYEYRHAIDERIKQICADKVDETISGYKVLYTNFMVKEPGIEGDFPVHQDWTYVDETKFKSYAIWIPLSDVDENNGALHVVKGSHRFLTALRGPYVHEPFSTISAAIKNKYSEVVRLHAGEALIWDHRVIHFSNPNISETARLAFTLIMVPKDADTMHCYGTPETKGVEIKKLRVDTDFFMRYTIGAKPDYSRLMETVEQPMKDVNEEEMEELIRKPTYV